MTARLSLGERPQLTASTTCTFTTRGAHQAPAFMKWVTNFLVDYWAFILAFSQTAWRPLAWTCMIGGLQQGTDELGPRSSYDGWVTPTPRTASEAQIEFGYARALHNS